MNQNNLIKLSQKNSLDTIKANRSLKKIVRLINFFEKYLLTKQI